MSRIAVLNRGSRMRAPPYPGPARVSSREAWQRSGVTDTSSRLSAPATVGWLA